MSVYNFSTFKDELNKKVVTELEIGSTVDEDEEDLDDITIENEEVDTDEDYSLDDDEDTEEDDYSLPEDNDSDYTPAPEEDKEESNEDYSLDDGEDDTEGEDQEDEDYSLDNTGENSDEGDTPEEEEEDENYSLDDTGEDNTSADDNTDSEDDNTIDTGEEDNEDQNVQDEINKLEDEIFNTLTPEQRKIKELELKKNFSTTYGDISDYIEKINKIVKTTDNIGILEKLTSSLFSLEEYLSYYIINTFNTKSYMENSIIFQKFLVSLVAIKNVLSEMEKEKPKS